MHAQLAPAAAALRCAAPLAEVPALRLAELGAPGDALAALVRAARTITLLSGAGISTASGVPDYRSPGRPAYAPLQHVDFMTKAATRRRYWARSTLGWARMAGARPNAGHVAVAALQRAGLLRRVITQNVDRLHTAAGAVDVLELHGSIHDVACEACRGWAISRHDLQGALLRGNAGWLAQWAPAAAPRPDGDVELPADAYNGFAAPTCPLCRSDLVKPQVTFHGGNVPAPVAEASLAAARGSDLLLVVGSTLSTWSACRLAKATAGAGGRVAIVNHGATRADELASVRVDAHTSSVLGALARERLPPPGGGGDAAAAGPPPPPR